MLTAIATLAATIALAQTPTAPPDFKDCIAHGTPVVQTNEQGEGFWIGVECHPSRKAIRHGAEPTYWAGLDITASGVRISVGP